MVSARKTVGSLLLRSSRSTEQSRLFAALARDVFSVGDREDQFEQLWSHGYEAEASVEAPSLLVALLHDDPERSRPLRDRISLRVVEKSMSDPAPLVARRD